MDNPLYNIGTGLIDINATTVSTDTLITDDINSQSGIININLSSLSNVQNLTANGFIISPNITSLSNAHIALSNAHITLSNAHINLSNAHLNLSNSFISYSNTFLKVSGCNLYMFSNLCIGTSSATQQLTLTASIQASNVHTSNLIVYRGSNVLDTDAKIDYNKWIKNGPVMTDDTGVIIIPLPVIVNIYNNINPSINTDTGGNGDENYDPNNNSSNIFVHWRNVIYHPFYCRTGTDEQVAFGSNVFIEKTSKIYGVDSVDLTKTDAGRTRRLDTNLLNPTVFYDFANQEMFLKVINCSSNINTSNIRTSNITTSNITTSNVNTSNINTINITTSNITSSNVNASNVSTASFTAINSFSSNLVASNCFSSNIVNVNLWSSNISSSNVSSCNYYGINGYLSNILTSNLFSSNITTSNLSTNLLQSTSINSQTGIITTITATTITTNNITACNIQNFSNDYYSFSNQSWKFNGSNIWHGSNEFAIAIGKSNATEKLDIVGNIKASGGGSFTNNNFVISSNTSAVHSLIINNSNILRTDGNIGNHFLTHLNNLAGNQTFTGTAGDTYDPKTQSSNLYTNWNSVLWKPIYQDNLFNLGFSSNVFFNRFSQLCTTESAWDYSKTSNGMFKTFSSPFVRSNVVIDFNTYTATLCNVITSNATINFNLTTSNIRTSNLLTSNITTSNITTSNIYGLNANLSNLWASNVGINQLNPLYNLDVNGGARIQTNLLVNRDIICTSNATFGSNVGIGTINPAYKLDVIGNARINSSFIGDVGFGSTTAGFAHTSRVDTASYALAQLNDGTTNLNSAPGRPIHFRTNGVIFMTMSNGWLGIGTPNPAYSLDVNGASAFRNGNANVSWSKNQMLFGFNGTNTYQHSINTRHQAGGGNQNSFDFMLWNNNVSSTTIGTINAMSITATGVGVMTSNPVYALDVLSNNMRVQGGASLTSPTILYLNPTGVANTTSQIQFVSDANFITCTDSNNYYFISNIGGGHNIYYCSGGHNFSGTARFSEMQVRGSSVIEFGQGVGGKEVSAGKVGYQTFTIGALDIVGAGATGSFRGVKIWDDLTVNNSIKIGAGDFFKGFKIVTQKVSDSMSYLVSETWTITHNLGTSSFEVFFAFRDTTNTSIEDSFTARCIGRTTTTATVRVRRADSIGWGTGPTMVCLFIAT